MAAVVRSADQFTAETGRTVRIVSGFRTEPEQDALRHSGRPTADNDRSTHLSCPATGVDVSLGALPVRVMKATWGRIVTFEGLRWGGGGALDDGGIPIDWQHADAGPRTQ